MYRHVVRTAAWIALLGVMFTLAGAAPPAGLSPLPSRSSSALFPLLPHWAQSTEHNPALPDDGDQWFTVLDLIRHNDGLAKSPGLIGRYTSFQTGEGAQAQASFDGGGLPVDVVKVAATLDQNQHASKDPSSLLGSGLRQWFHAHYQGVLYVPESARYTFILAYGDAMSLDLDGVRITAYEDGEPFIEAAVDLEEGWYPIQLSYRNGANANPNILFAWRSSGTIIGPNNTTVAAKYLWHRNPTETTKQAPLEVVFSPADGARVDQKHPVLQARLYGLGTQYRFWLDGQEVRVVDGQVQHALDLKPGINGFPWTAQSGAARHEGVLTLNYDAGGAGLPGLAAMFYPRGATDGLAVTEHDLPSQTHTLASLDLAAAPNGYPQLGATRVEPEQTLWLRGQVQIKQPGKYGFYLNAPAAAVFYLNGKPLLDNAAGRILQNVVLEAGYHDIALVTANQREAPTATLLWQQPGAQTRQPIPAKQLSHRRDQRIAAADFTWNTGDPARVGNDLIAEYGFAAEAPFADAGEADLDLPVHPRWRVRPQGGVAMSLPSQLKHRGLGTYFLTQAVANQAFTLEWDWTYAAADTESQQLFRINQRFSRNPVLLAYVRDGRFRFWFMGREFVNPHRLIADRRYHAAVTWDGSALHIYMNGEKSAKFEWNPEGFDAGLPRNLDFQIGDDQGFPVFGVLHGLALYARALDAAEIDINYAARNRVTETADTVTRQPVIPAGTTEEAVDLARHVLNRAAFGASPESLRALLTVGTESWLEQQLEPEQIALPASVTALEHIYQPQASKENLQAWLTARMVHSPRQLEEVMAWFWENHFHTDLTKTADPAAEYAENQRFRSLALGSFTDLLAASARNTPMIRYLDGDTNIAAAPNENYAREILELHSFGEDNGYNYADIVAAARIFSGWTYQDGVFHFAPGAHDYGVKALFGLRFDQREGADEGLVLIQHIATAPETAQFISTKLCRFFLADEPPQDAVDAATQRFLETDGDIREVVRTILFHPRFLDDAQYRGNKLKTPLEFVVSMQRAVGAADDQHVYRAGLEHMGMPLFDYPYPTGYAERGTPWRNTNAVFYRWQLVNQFCNNRRWANQPALDAAAWAARYGVSDAETAFDLLQAMLGFGPEHRAKMEPLLVQDNGRVFDLREAPERDHFVQRLSWVLNAGLRGAAFQHQ